MKIGYYYNQILKGAPVKQFLLKYDFTTKDSEEQKKHKIKVLAYIDQAIQFIAEHSGHPIPPVAATIRGYPFHEIRVKDSGNLIRILYFTFQQEKLVLLNVFEKPDFYEKRLKKKVEKQFFKVLEQTKIYYEDFTNNNDNYENYY